MARLLTDPIVYFFTFWLFSYLKTERHFTLAMIGAVGWIPFLASGIGGPGGGALSDWLVRRGWQPRRARLALMLLAACAMPVSIVAVLTPNAWLSIACIALILGSQSCWMANQLTLISESVPRTHAASLLALSALGGSIGGIAANRIAVRDGATWVPLGSGLGTGLQNQRVEALGEYSGALWAAGFFESAGGAPARHVARWGEWTDGATTLAIDPDEWHDEVEWIERPKQADRLPGVHGG